MRTHRPGSRPRGLAGAVTTGGPRFPFLRPMELGTWYHTAGRLVSISHKECVCPPLALSSRRPHPSHLPVPNTWGGLLSEQLEWGLGVTMPRAGPAPGVLVWVWGWGLLGWPQALAEEKGVPLVSASGESNKKQWGRPNTLGNSARWHPREGEGVPSGSRSASGQGEGGSPSGPCCPRVTLQGK